MRNALSLCSRKSKRVAPATWKAPTKRWLGNIKYLGGDVARFDGRDTKSRFRFFNPVLQNTQVRRPGGVLDGSVRVGGKAETLGLAVNAYPTRKTQRFAPGFSGVTDLVGPGLRGPLRLLLRGQRPDSNTKEIN